MPRARTRRARARRDLLVQTLAHFGVDATIVGQISGPRVVRYELQLAPGHEGLEGRGPQGRPLVRARRRRRSASSRRSRASRRSASRSRTCRRSSSRSATSSTSCPAAASPLAVWLGKDISGNAVWTDLARMPHLLIAGTTGSGKSGCINTLLTSILLARHAGRGAVDPDRPEADRAQLLRVDPAPADAGRLEPEGGLRGARRTSSPRWSGATSACRSSARAACPRRTARSARAARIRSRTCSS